MKKYVVAFDQGTTSTRTIVFDKQGAIVSVAQKELTQHYPKSGWVEHDPVEIYQDQLSTFKEALEKGNIDPSEIDSIGITNQRETTVVWNRKTGRPIYNAIVWLDKRTKEICNSIRELGIESYINENTGLVIDAYFSGTKLKWILDNVEGAKEQLDDLCFGTIDSWLIYNFSQEQNHVTDHTNASRTLLYNIRNLEWDSVILDGLEIPQHILPAVQSSSSHFGIVKIDEVEIPILGVAGDQQAALFGQGGFEPGVAKNTYGTGCFMLLNIGTEMMESQNGLLTTLACTQENNNAQYAFEGSVFVGGASIKWLRDNLKVISNASETEAICNSIPPLDNIYVVPAFAGLGAPYWDQNAKGAIYGMTLDTTKNEIIKATVDALAYQTKDVLDVMIEDSGKELTVLKVDGGASANNYLMQFQSDMLNVDVDRPKMIEVTAFGAASLAGLKSGFWTKNDISNIRVSDSVFSPKINSKERNTKYKGWLQAVDKTRTNKSKKGFGQKLKFSIVDRPKQFQRIVSKKYDLVVIGGGVTGAGIALDASARGMKVCLIEKNDFASGTSNKSTKLIHGGLRYLKQLEIGLVRETGSERAIVHAIAPHLVIPEKMLLPLVEGGTYGKMMTSIGLKVYDLLANVEGDDRRQMLDKESTLKKEPLLDENDLLGSGYYAEYRTDDARLTIEILKKAAEYGATIVNYCELESFVYDTNKQIESINCIDHNSGKKVNIRGRNFVSAAGPWVDHIREYDNSKNHKRLHLTKGVHLVFPKSKLPIQQSVYFDVDDGRMIFAIPRGKSTYVGTTDTNYDGDLDRVVATKEDAEYLIKAVNKTFPSIHLTIDDIESSWAGLRPLIHEEDKDPSDLSRKDEIFESETGLISIAGGKLTGYRKMAQRVLQSVIKTLPLKRKKKLKKSTTDKIPLVDPKFESYDEVLNFQKKLKEILIENEILDSYQAWYLSTTYGKNAMRIIDKMSFFSNKDPKERLLRAELWYGIHYEMINSLVDFYVRRTGRLYFDIRSIEQTLPLVLKECTKHLEWDAERVEKEKKELELLIQDATTFYDKEFD